MSDDADPGVTRPFPTVVTASSVAVATGLAWATAHPGPAVWWLALLVVPGWLTVAHLARDSRPRTLFGLGFLLGMAAFLPMLRWLALPATSLGWVLLAVTQALWVGGATVVVRRWTTHRAVAVVGPLVWTGMEVLRARYPLSGFGWGDLASAHTVDSWMLTSARVLGGDGLTLLTALLGGCAWAAIVAFRRVHVTGEVHEEGPTVLPGAARIVYAFDAARPLVLATIGVGALSVLITAEPLPAVGTADVLVVQGNDGTNAEVGRAEDLRIAEAHAEATVTAIERDGVPDLTVWAENALDRDPRTTQGADLAPSLQRAARAAEGRLLAGVLLEGDGPQTFRNAIVAVAEDGSIGDAYVKQKVVPFGEYVPWRSVLGDLGPLTRVPRDAIAGDGPRTIEVDGIRVATIICFETLFADTVREAVAQDDAQLLVAATNDASFGRGAESAQHVAQSRLRAVETGRSVIHASISGTSAIITSSGEVLALGPLFEVATLRETVDLVEGRTIAASVAPWLSGLLQLVGVALAVAAVALRRRSTSAEDADAAEAAG